MAETKPAEPVDIAVQPGQDEHKLLAEMRLNPFLRHAQMANVLAAVSIKVDGKGASAIDAETVLNEMAQKAASGDMTHASGALLSQSVLLDVTMTELMRRAWQNAGEYPEAFQRYMTLALKAQAQSRATIEALAKIHQPREQVVRHVHVHEGGQAVVADEFHHHAAGGQNAEIIERAQASGAGGPGERPALRSPDQIGPPLPGGGDPRETAVPHARRRERKRRPAG